jgi:signal peptidase I
MIMSESKDIIGDSVGSAGRGWSYEFWEIVKIIIISLVIVLPIRYFIVQPFIVRGASMEPNFEDHDYLIVDEISYYFRAPLRGESIVFRFPRDPHQFFIKRIVGLPGEKVEIRNGEIYILNKEFPNGFRLDESYLVPLGRLTRPDFTIILGADEYFVLGDNRDFSSDSRVWGALKRKFIVGRVLFRAWPPAKFGMVPDFAVSY